MSSLKAAIAIIFTAEFSTDYKYKFPQIHKYKLVQFCPWLANLGKRSSVMFKETGVNSGDFPPQSCRFWDVLIKLFDKWSVVTTWWIEQTFRVSFTPSFPSQGLKGPT